MSKVLDVLLGGEQPVSVMQTGPVRTERKDGLLGAVSDPLRWAPGPVGAVAEAANAYAEGGMEGLAKSGADVALGLFGARAAPLMRRVVTRAERVPNAQHTWKGADDILRANIDDRKARLVNTLPTKGSIPLGDLMEHDELYKLYPDMKGIPVEKMDEKLVSYYGEGTKAAYTTRNGKPLILLNPKGSPKEWLSSLLHESTHEVQRAEGLLSGSNPVKAQELADKVRTEFSLAMAEDPKRAQRILRDAKKNYGIDVGVQKQKVVAPSTFQVIDTQTGKVVREGLANRSNALKSADRLDNQYGAVRYKVQEVPGKTQWRDPLAEQLYTKQQGEQDAFLTQDIYAHQMEKQRPYMTTQEFESVPQPPLPYRFGTPIDSDTIFENLFGYRAFDDTVDMTTSGTRGFRGKIKDSDILGY